VNEHQSALVVHRRLESHQRRVRLISFAITWTLVGLVVLIWALAIIGLVSLISGA
jgi:type VI protein secretion system component VasF